MNGIPRGAAILSVAGLIALLACGGAGSTSSPESPSLVVTDASDVAFGDVGLGDSTSRTVTLTNTSGQPVTITDVSASGAAFVTSGQALPLTLQAGASTSLALELAPSAAGDLTGTVTITSSDSQTPIAVRLLGKGTHPQSTVTASPAAIAFGSVAVGDRVSRQVTLTNGGTRDVRVTTVAASGAGVSVSTQATPFTLPAGQSASLDVAFAPSAAGDVQGRIAVGNDANRVVAVLTVGGSGAALAAPPVALAVSPAALDFGNVTVGTFSARSVTLTNTSGSPVELAQLEAAGAGFSVSGLSAPATLAPGQSAALTVRYSPAATGTSSGTLSVRSPAQPDPLAVVSFSGSGVAAASITSVSVRDAAVLAGGSVQLVADVVAVGTIDKSVTWALDAGTPGGSVNATTGLYTAPSTSGSYRVWATSKADPTKSGSAVVTVSAPAPVSVSVNPATASVAAGATTSFSAAVSGTTNTAVTWTVQEGAAGGSITTAGAYTAPATAGTYHVVATSGADRTKSATATVTVTAPAPVPGAGDIGACTRLVSDGSYRSAGSLALPGYNPSNPLSASIVDPVFGTRITRVTGNPGDSIPNTSASWRTDKPYAGPVYSKDSPWNADQSVLAIKAGVSAQTLFVDGNTYVPLYTRFNTKPEYRWHPTDPRYMIYVDSNGQAGYFEPATNAYTVKFNPGSGFNSCTIGSYEGNVSYDGRWVVVQCLATGVSGDAAYVFFAADLQTGTKYPTIRAIDLGFSGANTSDHAPLDWASISPLGNYIVASQDWQQQRVITLDGASVSGWGAMGHYDLGVDASGAEVAYNGGSPVYRRLSDGAAISLPWPGGSEAYHSSTRDNRAPGWGYSSLESATATLDGEIVAHELKGGGRIRRIAHHRATSASYDRAAFAAVSPDGKRVLFRSDWGNASGAAYGFVVDIRNVCP